MRYQTKAEPNNTSIVDTNKDLTVAIAVNSLEANRMVLLLNIGQREIDKDSKEDK
jgi:hypothetical protein